MSKANLLILVSRMKGDRDEWETVWKHNRNDLIAFIRPGKKTVTRDFQMFTETGLTDQLDAGVWVIHGMALEGARREVLYEALNEVDWQKRNVTLRFHLGQGDSVSEDEFKEHVEGIKYENTRELLKNAEDYGIGDPDENGNDPPNNPVVRFARVVNEGDWDNYEEYLQAVAAPRPLHLRIANVMHHLSYVLHPLDLDFQGLLETDFQLEYWKDVVAEYKGGKAIEKLKKTRELVYGNGAVIETAESIIADADRRFGKGEWAAPWEELQKQHLPKTEGPASVKDILPLIQDESEINLNSVQTYFSDGKNPVHEWVKNLNRSLGKIRDALRARESS